MNRKNEKEKLKRREISKEEEKRIRRTTNIILYTFSVIVLILLSFLITDYIRYRQNKLPIFALSFKVEKENEPKEYHGLGYKIVKLNNFEINDLRFGSWFMKYDDPNKDSHEYNKRKEVNAYKLNILEELDKITKKEANIPKDSEKYIKENKDLYNQIKERENTYIYALELILHSEDATQFGKYILARIINEKNENIDFKFKDSTEFIKKYEEHLSKLNYDELKEDDLDKIGYDIIFENPEFK